MKKVVIITNAPAPYRVAFFRYLQEHETDYQFHVIYTSGNQDIGRQWRVSEEELGAHSFLECRVITIRRRYDDKRIVLSKGVTGQLAALNPAIVVCMEYNATILQAVHWCKKKHIPYISWSDGTANSERSINALQKLFRKYVIRGASSYISSSTATMEHQIRYGAQRKHCHKSLLTVDIEQYLYEKPDVKASVDAKPAYTLLYVGSLIGRKGLDLLFASLPQTRAQIRLLVVGEGSEEQALREQVHELSIEDRVTFCGYAEGEELKGYYREADAFVLPTREDCYGLVLLEALCASLPVIASVYADGARDLIEDGVQGYLVDPYDAAALAGAIDAMFEDYGTLARMQKESYKRAKQFCFPAVAEGFFEALEDT